MAGPTSRIEFRDGRPVIVFDGQPISQAMYFDAVCCTGQHDNDKPAMWFARNLDFIRSGVKTLMILPANYGTEDRDAGRFWTDDGVYPECSPADDIYCLDRQATDLVEADPEVRLFVRFSDRFNPGWFRANPGHTAQASSGKLGRPRASMASDKALADLCTYLQRVVTYAEAQPWARRVVGYVYFAIGEGTVEMNCQGHLFDQCDAMQDAYRAFVRRKYADEAALRKGWGDREVTFDAVRVPTDESWRQRRAEVSHWTEGSQLAAERDYMLLQRELFIRWYQTLVGAVREALGQRQAIFGIDLGKIQLSGWQIRQNFSGTGPTADFIDMLAGSGNIDIAELLDTPGLDFLWTPADYTARGVGYGFEPEGVADSLRLRGKMMLCENDCRTFNPGAEDHTQGAFRDVAELKAGMLRNSAWGLTRGHMDYWMIPCGSYFHNDTVQEEGIQLVRPLLDAAPNWPHVETEHAIAMVLDDTSFLHEDFSTTYQCQAVLWQRVLGLAHCGVPYRIYLWSDLLNENMPDYRCYLFPNLFELNDERLAVLERKVFRDGRMAIFGPATGITDGTTLGAEGASRLLGVDMELHRLDPVRRAIVFGNHPITKPLPASTIYGDSVAYGPLLIPGKDALAEAGAEELGMALTCFPVNRPGLFVHTRTGGHGPYTVAWSVAVPLPAGLLRELARYGGCHVWCEEDDVVLASETVAALHSVKAGPRTLHLPTPRPVWDLVNREPLGEMDRIELALTPPETHVFYFGDEDPYGEGSC